MAFSTHVWLCVCICLGICIPPSLGVPPQHRGWLRLWEEGEGCGECDLQRCPLALHDCPAGRVRDSCGCCEQCGNVEGQQCDPDGAQEFYGRCGEGLVCQRKTKKGRRGRARENPEPKCVCQAQGPVCGSDGYTYPNSCQLKEAASRGNATLRLTGHGPCYSAPRISRAPKDLSNYTGNDIVFGCEVTAYPLPNLSWRKKGSDNFLPGDDPHISVQARGGPQRYTVSTWLQIQGLHTSDAGVYSCISHNALGELSASARLTVLRQMVRVMRGRQEKEEEYFYDDTEEGSDDGQSGDYLE
ncbi:kazal-type serine protease inhibitor domain-containing protein 1-like [Osmerus mordax]|uniref:kazal-type serine protease inhibitor domain-containing protein 1-like n=1 Tax=Osmerus mordax TaxID=8014 RepID=UPI00350EAB5C